MKTKYVDITEDDIKVGAIFYSEHNSDTCEIVATNDIGVLIIAPNIKRVTSLSFTKLWNFKKKVIVRENWINIHPDTHHIISAYPHATEEIAKQQVVGTNYIQIELNL